MYKKFLSIKKDMNTLIKRVDDDVTKNKVERSYQTNSYKSQTKNLWLEIRGVSSLLRHYELVKELKKL